VAVAADAIPVAELPLSDYDARETEDIIASLPGLGQRDLRAIDIHESLNANRAVIRDRIIELTGDEPWVGYDRQASEAITHFLGRSSAHQARDVHAYERAHRDRPDILSAASTRLRQQPA
jgi:hypothetical protein